MTAALSRWANMVATPSSFTYQTQYDNLHVCAS
jgi:hypothetical protein